MFAFSPCPRCASNALENLATYSHCIDCLYVDDRDYDLARACLEAVKTEANELQEADEESQSSKLAS